ncbi:pyruvate kinase [Tanacetum coccineum]
MFLTTRSIRSTISRASTVAATPLPPLYHLPTGATTAAPPPPFGCYPATATPPSSSSCHHHLRPPSSSLPSSQPPHHKGAAGLCLNSQKGAPGLGIAPQKGALDFGSHPRGSANRSTTSIDVIRKIKNLNSEKGFCVSVMIDTEGSQIHVADHGAPSSVEAEGGLQHAPLTDSVSFQVVQ